MFPPKEFQIHPSPFVLLVLLGLFVTLGDLCAFRKPQLVARCSETLLGGSNSLWSSPSFVYRFGQRLQGDLIVDEPIPRGKSSRRIE